MKEQRKRGKGRIFLSTEVRLTCRIGVRIQIQTMAGFTGAGGAADNLSSAPSVTDTSQQPLVTASQHG
jgi:hypothetical protein